MDDIISDLYDNFSTLIISLLALVTITVFISFSLKVLETYKIKQSVENAVTDILSYGAFHSGFNDGADGSYTFNEHLDTVLGRYGLVQGDNIQSINLDPVGTGYIKHRLEELTVSITPIYPSLNALKPNETRVGQPITGTTVTHSFVKYID